MAADLELHGNHATVTGTNKELVHFVGAAKARRMYRVALT